MQQTHGAHHQPLHPIPGSNPPPVVESTGITSRIGGILRFALENLENFWFVPIGLVFMFGAGRRLMPLNVLVFGGGTLAGVVLSSQYKGKFTKGEEKEIGLMIGSAALIVSASIISGIAVFALRNVPKALNYVAPIAGGLTGLLTGRSLIHRFLGSTDSPPGEQENVPGYAEGGLWEDFSHLIFGNTDLNPEEVAAGARNNLATNLNAIKDYVINRKLMDEAEGDKDLSSVLTTLEEINKITRKILEENYVLTEKDYQELFHLKNHLEDHPFGPYSHVDNYDVDVWVTEIRTQVVGRIQQVVDDALLLPMKQLKKTGNIGRGDCFYHSVSQVIGKPKEYTSLRDKTAEELRNHGDRESVARAVHEPEFRGSERFQKNLKTKGVRFVFPKAEDEVDTKDLNDIYIGATNSLTEAEITTKWKNIKGYYDSSKTLASVYNAYKAFHRDLNLPTDIKMGLEQLKEDSDWHLHLFKNGMPCRFFPKTQYDRLITVGMMHPQAVCQLVTFYQQFCTEQGLDACHIGTTFLGVLHQFSWVNRWQDFLKNKSQDNPYDAKGKTLPIVYPTSFVHTDQLEPKEINSIVNAYCDQVAVPTTWASLPEVKAMASVVERPIVILQRIGAKWVLHSVATPRSYGSYEPIYVKYDGAHFEAMVPK